MSDCSCKSETKDKKPDDSKTTVPVYSMSAGCASSGAIR